MQFFRLVKYGEETPRLRGFVWPDPWKGGNVTAPVPINVPIRLAWLALMWVRFPWYKRGSMEETLRAEVDTLHRRLIESEGVNQALRTELFRVQIVEMKEETT